MIKFNDKEKKYMEYCSRCFQQHGNKCVAQCCYLGVNNEDRDFYLETELWNKMFHSESVKECKHHIIAYYGFDIENNKTIPKHGMLAKYHLLQCSQCGKILGIFKPKKPKRKFKVH